MPMHYEPFGNSAGICALVLALGASRRSEAVLTGESTAGLTCLSNRTIGRRLRPRSLSNSVRTEFTTQPRPGTLPCDLGARPEHRFVGIVRGTAQLQVRDARLAPIRVGDHVMELEEAARPASAMRADERALTVVAPPDRARDRRRNVARPGRRGARLARFRRGRALLPLEMLHEQRERSFKDDGDAGGRQCMPEQILRAAKPMVPLARECELDLVGLRRERPNDGAGGVRRCEVERLGRRSRRRPLANRCGDWRLRPHPRDEELDFPLALVGGRRPVRLLTVACSQPLSGVPDGCRICCGGKRRVRRGARRPNHARD